MFEATDSETVSANGLEVDAQDILDAAEEADNGGSDIEGATSGEVGIFNDGYDDRDVYVVKLGSDDSPQREDLDDLVETAEDALAETEFLDFVNREIGYSDFELHATGDDTEFSDGGDIDVFTNQPREVFGSAKMADFDDHDDIGLGYITQVDDDGEQRIVLNLIDER